MTAREWRICPRCRRIKFIERQKAAQAARDGYGIVPADEYAELLRKAAEPFEMEENLREDYEIWTNEDGRFYIDYRATCHVSSCGFEVTFTRDQQQKV